MPVTRIRRFNINNKHERGMLKKKKLQNGADWAKLVDVATVFISI